MALLQVPEPFQRVLVLHYIEQLPVTTVAQILGVPEGTIKSRLTRGRCILKQVLDSRQVHQMRNAVAVDLNGFDFVNQRTQHAMAGAFSTLNGNKPNDDYTYGGFMMTRNEEWLDEKT